MDSVFQLLSCAFDSSHVCVVEDVFCIWTRTSIYLCLVGERSSQDVDEWVSVEFHAEFHMFPTCVVSKMWKFVVKHCGARGVGMSVDEEVRSWCGTIIDCPLLQEVCESSGSSTEPRMPCDPVFVNTRCFAVNVAEHVLSCNSVVLWLLGSWGTFSWFVVCTRSVDCCPDPCVVRSKLLMLWLVRCVSWMTFPSDTCFRVGGGFFTEGWRVSSVFTGVVSLVLRNARFIIARENCFVRSACLFASAIIQWWDRWRVGHGVGVILIYFVWRRLRHLSEKPTHVWTLFSCAHVVCREFAISCFFPVVWKRFLVGASPTTFLRPTLRSKIVWRVPHVFSIDDDMEHYTFREISNLVYFSRPHIGA